MKRLLSICTIGLFFLGSVAPARAGQDDPFIEGVLLLKQGKLPEAAESLERASSRSDNTADACYYLGTVYYRQGKMEQALEQYKKAIEMNAANPSYRYEAARLYIDLGDDENALRELGEAVRIAPQSVSGKKALALKKALEGSLNARKTTENWAVKEKELLERETEAKKTAVATKGVAGENPGAPGMPGMPGAPGIPGMPGGMPGMMGPGGLQQQVDTQPEISVETLVKQLKFGTDTKRKAASTSLFFRTPTDLAPFIGDFLPLLTKEKKSDIRTNIIAVIGKTETKEGNEALLSLIENKNESFVTKLTSLDSLPSALIPEMSSRLRASLDGMVSKRIADREEARRNLDTVSKELDDVDVEILTLNQEIQNIQNQKRDVDSKLGMTGDMGMAAGAQVFGGGAGVPGMAGGGTTLKPAELKKLKEQQKKFEQDLNAKQEKLPPLQEKKNQLTAKRDKYNSLLAKKAESKKAAPAVAAPTAAVGMPPGFGGGAVPGMMGGPAMAAEKTDEDRAEQTFALTLLKTLGRIRDTASLPVIKKAWIEYGDDNAALDYALTRARLVDYEEMPLLIAHLKEDFPADTASLAIETKLRSGILEVTGEYLKGQPDEETLALVQFLAGDDTYPDIKNAATNALSSPKKPSSEPKKQ